MNITVPATLTPSRLRILLLVALVLTAIAGAGVFYLAYNRLSQTATEAGSQAASARESQNTLQRLQMLRGELEERRDTISTTSRVMANSQNYAYQDRLVSDLTVYANRANLSISNISFSGQASGGGGGDASAGENSAAPAPGLRKATVDITLQNPVNYQDLLNFLHYVETNLTKLRVSRVTMTKGDADSVTVDSLNLEVYVR